MSFAEDIKRGIPDELPPPFEAPAGVNRAPKRRDVLTPSERELALANALRYIPARHHGVLARELAQELRDYGRIYMFRFRPRYEILPRPLPDTRIGQ